MQRGLAEVDTDAHRITDAATLAVLYGEPGEASIRKEVDRLHPVYRAIVEAAPFAVLATAGPGGLDASPRGDARSDRPSLKERESRHEDRPPRDDGPRREARPPREDHPRRSGPSLMETFRLEVGSVHGIKPGNIVGAIANEAGIEGVHIGRVDIREDHSYVDLPEGMPKAIFKQLQKVRVAGRELRISRVTEKPPKPREEPHDE